MVEGYETSYCKPTNPGKYQPLSHQRDQPTTAIGQTCSIQMIK